MQIQTVSQPSEINVRPSFRINTFDYCRFFRFPPQAILLILLFVLQASANVSPPKSARLAKNVTSQPVSPATVGVKVKRDPPKEITIGYITNLDPKSQLTPGRLISGAMTYALHKVNADPNILPNTTLKFVVADTHNEENLSLLHASEFIKDGVYVIIGPEMTCVHEAMLAGVYNVPMISYARSLGIKSHAGTFIRHSASSHVDRYQVRYPAIQVKQSFLEQMLILLSPCKIVTHAC
ncbi:Receptor-type guanylate cyclase Gyc76C [Bulinus truncatus]|nr:Receptor-type guanylate cyclase Gyc76C [Bulinus truncatus]